MKLKITIASLVWLVVISFAHVGLNTGFEKFAHNLRVYFGEEREELVVGFLPVT